MFTTICLIILSVIVGLVGLTALFVGLIKHVRSILIIGFSVLSILVACICCYLLGWKIPVILAIGGIAFSFTLVGTSGEESKNSFKFGVLYLIIGLYLFFNTFLLWFESGHHTSMAFTAWFMCFTLLLNALNCKVDYIPILSLVTSIVFALFAIYLWMFLGLKGMPVFWSGTFAAIFARSLWWLVYGRKMEEDERLTPQGIL